MSAMVMRFSCDCHLAHRGCSCERKTWMRVKPGHRRAASIPPGRPHQNVLDSPRSRGPMTGGRHGKRSNAQQQGKEEAEGRVEQEAEGHDGGGWARQAEKPAQLRQEITRFFFEHDLFRKPVPTFRDHASSLSMNFSENRYPLFGIML